MRDRHLSRRDFVKSTAALASAATVPYWFTTRATADESKNNRPIIGAIGVGSRGTVIAGEATAFGDLVAVCDVDRQHAENAKEKLSKSAEIHDDYRKLLDRKDIEAVIIGTPDHWHVPICLAALAAGKHIYCEKPLSLTVAEGRQLVDAVKKSGKTLQVGTMQRSRLLQFARTVATVRSGQLGKIQKVTVSLPLSNLEGGPFAKQPVPKELNWDMWQGQAPVADYCPERCHYTFRWWFDYSGGVMTDWGAHHLDITQWALDCENAGPLTVDGSKTVLPNILGGYNTPKRPFVTFTYPNDVLVQTTQGSEGILFEGEKGTIHVSRRKVEGAIIEEQNANPKLKEKVMADVYGLFRGNYQASKDKKHGDHMANFFEAFKHNKWPVSDVESQHRSVSACHVANISIRLGRKLTWDAAKEKFVGDDEANAMLQRPQRSPYQFS